MGAGFALLADGLPPEPGRPPCPRSSVARTLPGDRAGPQRSSSAAAAALWTGIPVALCCRGLLRGEARRGAKAATACRAGRRARTASAKSPQRAREGSPSGRRRLKREGASSNGKSSGGFRDESSVAVKTRSSSSSRRKAVPMKEEGFLADVNEELEWEKVWEMRRDLRRFCGDPDGRSPTLKREALLFFEAVMSDYSNLVTSMQINRIPATLAATGLVAYDTYDLRQQLSELEDTLSWRPLANDLGLRAYALDLFHLIELHPPSKTPVGVKNKAQGFGAGGNPTNRKFTRPDELKAIKDSMHIGSHVAMVADTVQSSHGEYAKLRIVLPSTIEGQVQDALRARNLAQDFDILTFNGSAPTADLLMSEENCSVLLVLEDMATPQGAWTVPVMSLGAMGAQDFLGEDLGPDELAPVLVVSVLCHSVEMKVEPCIRRIIPVLEHLIMNGIREEAQLLNLFTDFFAISGPPQETQNAELLKEASEELMSKVGPLIRQAYGSSFGEMRQARLKELARARSAWLEENGRRRKREAKRKAALDELEKAASAYDTETFQRLAQEAKRDGVLEDAEGRDMEESLYAELEAMEAPFKRLVEKNSAPRPGGAATVSLAVEEARKALAGSKLPAGSGWRRAGEDLVEALQVLSELRKEAGSLEFRHHQSPAALRVAVLESSAKLKLGEAALVRFEGAVRSAGVKLGTEGAAPLRSVLKESRDCVEVGMRDQALWECLNGAPWSLPELRIDEFNSADLKKLEDICAKASGVALSHFAKPLEAALSRGKCAAQLLRATEAEDRAKLEELLAQASEEGLVALEDLEFALREMKANEEVMGKVRTNAKEVMAKMDVALFEEFVATVVGGTGVKLPEEQELRKELFMSIRKAELALREPLMEAVEDLQGLPSLRAAIKATSLPSSNRWRGGAEACAEALQVAASVRRATALASEANREEEASEDPLQALPSAVAGISALGEALEGVPAALELLAAQGDELEEERLSAAPAFVRAHEEGQVVLRGLRADRALRGRLMEEPWCLRPLPLEEALGGDMDELQKLAEGATMDGLRRATAALDAAFAAGRCARSLDKAMQNGTDAHALEHRLREAKSLGFSGLEGAEAQLEEMRRLKRLEAELEAQERQEEIEAKQEEEQRLRQEKQEEEVADQVEAERRRDVRWNEVVGENSNLIFLDLELTSGFYEFDEIPRVLEAAVVVTDKNLNEIAQGSWVLGGFSHEELSELSAFHQAHFRDAGTMGKFPPREGDLVGFGNGLFSDVLGSALTKEQVEEEIITVLRQHCPPGACPLAGYSVQCDREVLRREMPRLYRYVSHQIVDVSSFMRMARVTDPERVRLWDRRASRYNHRALNDARDAIEALRWVLDEFFRQRRV